MTVHKNLFLSFITNNFMWIVWYTYVVNDANLLQSNPVSCATSCVLSASGRPGQSKEENERRKRKGH